MTEAQIIKSKQFSPGLIGGEKMLFLEAHKGFFYMKKESDPKYLKDDKEKYIFLPLKDVVKARLLYLTTYAEQEKEEKIHDELLSLQKEVEEKSVLIIKNITQNENWKNGKTEGTFMDTIMQAFPEQANQYKQKAELFFTQFPDSLNLRDSIQKCLDEKKFYDLYQMFNQPPLIASFSIGENVDMTALINIFGAANINQTIDELKEDPLRLIAKVNVEKKYYPE